MTIIEPYDNADMPHEQVDQRLANYRPAEDIAAACAMCAHYDAAFGTCELVAGFVRVDYQCDLFAACDLQSMTGEADLVEMSGEYGVVKSDDTQQIIFGWANVAITKSGDQTLDAHSDLIDANDLELAAYDFMLNARVSGEDHAGTVDAECVESIVFTKEKAAALGIPEGLLPEAGWWVGFHIPDRDAYLRAKAEKSMFSIEGTAVREHVVKSATAMTE
ncbi:Phage-like element PBSX protein, XkdF [uncultured Caudovirales phage]|uniref:Phage-like element PBSX protein, XkdF n=1 Tax=uncultured Caudovirales phage TaxID=2100421 RepID=A0A6J5PDX2_9CAUD|nr:Phage-like element PBSX protein, XkdF [uncultured Caudovirales phage]CAB4198227.1 Phage-like element PBSX protein, XkdF [uncultured Caudovirales phage]